MSSTPETLEQSYHLAIVGPEELILGFAAFGFKVYAVTQVEEFRQRLNEIARDNIAICLLEENLYRLANEEIAAYRESPLPVFLPFAKEGTCALLENLVKAIRLRATGA
jgi:vacuolar-type H+-ATPase subunit F/Vma7